MLASLTQPVNHIAFNWSPARLTLAEIQTFLANRAKILTDSA
jgi:hypothetical protein